MKRVKRFTFWFSHLLCGRIYPFFDIHKEFPLMLQKIPNVSSHPHSVKMSSHPHSIKMTTEYNHTYRVNPPYSSPFFPQFPVLNLMTKVETVNLKKKTNIQASIPHESTQMSSSLSFSSPSCMYFISKTLAFELPSRT